MNMSAPQDTASQLVEDADESARGNILLHIRRLSAETKVILSDMAEKLEPHRDAIAMAWWQTAASYEGLSEATINRLACVNVGEYLSDLKAGRFDAYFASVFAASRECARADISFTTLAQSLTDYENACLPYLRTLYPNLSDRSGVLQALDYLYLNVHALLQRAYFAVQAERLRQQTERLQQVNELARAVNSRLDAPSIRRVAVGYVERALPQAAAIFLTVDPAHEAVTLAAVSHKARPLITQMKLAEGVTFPVAETRYGECLSRRQQLYAPDLALYETPLERQMVALGLWSAVTVPVVCGAEVVGLLSAARPQRDAFHADDVNFLSAIAEHLAIASHNAQLYAQLQTAHDDLQHVQQQVVQQERLRALGTMASGIAHDFNNALSPILGYSELLLLDETLSERGHRYLEIIRTAAQDAVSIVARLREFYRERGEREFVRTDMNAIVRQVVSLTQPRWRNQAQERGAQVEICLDLAEDLPPVLGDVSELHLALVNLVLNAVDALPQGGTITLRTRAEGGNVLVEVSDTGVGMDAETQQRIFDPFFTTKGEHGTGLGLSVAWGIAQRHHGDIEATSVVGQGSTFTLRLPAAEGETVQTRSVIAPPNMPSLRILYIDDEPSLRTLLQDMLRRMGHQVETAAGGVEGLAKFEATAYDVVITDLGMPGMSGQEVAQGVKAARPQTPVILLTGWGQRLHNGGEARACVDAVVSKPPTPQRLAETLAWVWREKFIGC